jgi:hypothetical protein
MTPPHEAWPEQHVNVVLGLGGGGLGLGLGGGGGAAQAGLLPQACEKKQQGDCVAH